VELKTEADGRMFPVTDSSATIIDCLHGEATRCGVILRPETGVRNLRPDGAKWIVETTSGAEEMFDRVLVATGGWKDAALVANLRHVPETPVPSLFSFHLPDASWLRALPGLTIENVRLQLEGTKISSTGPLLVTHLGISGPAVLKLSARGARILSERNYSTGIQVRWLPEFQEATLQDWIAMQRRDAPARKPANTPPPGLPMRFWEALLMQSGAPDPETRWTTLPRAKALWMSSQLLAMPWKFAARVRTKKNLSPVEESAAARSIFTPWKASFIRDFFCRGGSRCGWSHRRVQLPGRLDNRLDRRTLIGRHHTRIRTKGPEGPEGPEFSVSGIDCGRWNNNWTVSEQKWIVKWY
jgi:predicted flavoprotein YhiN